MEQFIGQIKLFAGDYAPQGWLLCNGQILNISQYQALFTIIGPTFGGDGRTTFALPNLQGSAVVHPSNTILRGKKGGSETKQLVAANFPAHTHTVSGKIKSKSTKDTQSNPVGNYPANSDGFDREYQTASNEKMAADAITGVTVATAGAATIAPVSNMQPYVAVNFIIAWDGDYLPRP